MIGQTNVVEDVKDRNPWERQKVCAVQAGEWICGYSITGDSAHYLAACQSKKKTTIIYSV